MSLTLQDVEAAISAAMRGQSYTMPDGRQVTRGSLAELVKLRDTLRAEASVEDFGGGLYRRLEFGEPS